MGLGSKNARTRTKPERLSLTIPRWFDKAERRFSSWTREAEIEEQVLRKRSSLPATAAQQKFGPPNKAIINDRLELL